MPRSTSARSEAPIVYRILAGLITESSQASAAYRPKQGRHCDNMVMVDARGDVGDGCTYGLRVRQPQSWTWASCSVATSRVFRTQSSSVALDITCTGPYETSMERYGIDT